MAKQYMFFRSLYKTEKVTENKRCPKLITNLDPKGVAGIVAQFLTTRGFANVTKTCRGSRALFTPSRSLNKLQNLLQAVAYADLKEAEKLINSDPTLLLKSGTVTDFSGRTHSNRTAFQLALGACDYHVEDSNGNLVVRGMVEKLVMLFNKLPQKTEEQIREIIRDQYRGQFPEGHEAQDAKRIADDSAALQGINDVIADLKDVKDCTAVSELEDVIYTIIRKEKSERADEIRKLIQNMLDSTSKVLFEEAFKAFSGYLIDHHMLIKYDAFNVDLLKALYQFRWHIKPKGNQTTGKHFNYQLLDEASDLCINNYARFGNDSYSPQNLFYRHKVLGGVQRHLPACDFQSIVHGLSFLFDEGEESRRALDFRFGGGEYVSLDSYSDGELGHDYALIDGRGRVSICMFGGGMIWVSPHDFKLYIKQKQQCEQMLSSSLDNKDMQLDKLIARG